MTDHIRKQVRQYVVERLIGHTYAEDRVTNSQFSAFMDRAFPFINVATPSERFVEMVEESPYTVRMVMDLVIEPVIQQSVGFADALDDLCQQVEQRIDAALGGLVESCLYDNTETFFSEEGDVPLGLARITYTVTYLKQEAFNLEDLTELNTIHVIWDMADPNNGATDGPDGQIDAQDTVTV